ncbi:MAG: GNAT family N-acetyltransferase [Chloroflexota bacterium]
MGFMPTIITRAFSGIDDVHRITQFLLDTYTLNKRLHNWEPRRWIGHIYHRDSAEMAAHLGQLSRRMRIWQSGDGAIFGTVIAEYPGSVFLQVHPEYRQIEHDMLDWAETHLSEPTANGGQRLEVWTYDYDTQRQDLLAANGYQSVGYFENLRRRSNAMPPPDITIPPDYRIRSAYQTPQEQQAIADLLNAGFRRTIHTAEEYATFQTHPFYDPELDIMVEVGDGVLAATAGLTCHPQHGFAMLEPVCTHPDHEGRGLAKATIAEGLRRLRAHGIHTVYVSTAGNNAPANHVYDRMGFSHVERSQLWRKVW